jgi:thiol-disulfide isomerase/thioredoxin
MRLPVVLLALAAALLGGCASDRHLLVSSPLLGKPLNVVAPRLDGREVSTGEARGRVQVVDFWATWCEPCRLQLPVLERLGRTYADQKLEVYGVSVDEDRAYLQAYLEATPVDITILWDRGGATASERLDLQRLPTTFVVDRAGRIRFVHQGYEPRNAALLEAEVRRLLAEPAP